MSRHSYPGRQPLRNDAVASSSSRRASTGAFSSRSQDSERRITMLRRLDFLKDDADNIQQVGISSDDEVEHLVFGAYSTSHTASTSGPPVPTLAVSALETPSRRPLGSTGRSPVTPSGRNTRAMSSSPYKTSSTSRSSAKKKKADRARESLRALLDGTGDERVDVRDDQHVRTCLKETVQLHPHQMSGSTWIAAREKDVAGGMLCDDMGLGKTVTLLDHIAADAKQCLPELSLVRNTASAHSEPDHPTDEDKRSSLNDEERAMNTGEDLRPTLIIAPPVITIQWLREIEQKTIGLRVLMHVGDSSDRTRDTWTFKGFHIVISKYGILANERKKYIQEQAGAGTTEQLERSSESPMLRFDWYRVILDEAHNIKNRNASRTKACLALRSELRWVVTGTPLQVHFNINVRQPINSGQISGMSFLQRTLTAWMLRRTKGWRVNGQPIIVLPRRILHEIICTLGPDDRADYNWMFNRASNNIQALLNAPAEPGCYVRVYNIVLRSRQICVHPDLLTARFRRAEAGDDFDSDNEEDVSEELEEDINQLFVLDGKIKADFADTTPHCTFCGAPLTYGSLELLCKPCQQMNVVRRKLDQVQSARAPHNDEDEVQLPPMSAKFSKAISILRDIREKSDGKEKAIIFSQWTTALHLLGMFLTAETIKFVQFTGAMNTASRQQALKSIREDNETKVILVSLMAGYSGLDLPCCNHVILMDPWWNPAVEEQAFDHAHRVGQERDVHIYKLIADETLELNILLMQDRKRKLAAMALGSGVDATSGRLSLDQLLNLFRPPPQYESE